MTGVIERDGKFYLVGLSSADIEFPTHAAAWRYLDEHSGQAAEDEDRRIGIAVAFSEL